MSHGIWLLPLLREVLSSAPDDGEAALFLRRCERYLHHVMDTRDGGAHRLLHQMKKLLSGGPVEGVEDTHVDPHIFDKEAGTEMVQLSILKSFDELAAVMRVLRDTAQERRDILLIHENDGLAWLRLLLRTGTAMLHDSAVFVRPPRSMRATKDGPLSKGSPPVTMQQLLCLLKFAADIIACLLSSLENSGLTEYHDSSTVSVRHCLLPSPTESRTLHI